MEFGVLQGKAPIKQSIIFVASAMHEQLRTTTTTTTTTTREGDCLVQSCKITRTER